MLVLITHLPHKCVLSSVDILKPVFKQATLGAPEFNTLDEPIKETILRDLGAVASKFYHVLYPKSVAQRERE